MATEVKAFLNGKSISLDEAKKYFICERVYFQWVEAETLWSQLLQSEAARDDHLPIELELVVQA